MIVLGIDPGTKCGWAVVSGGRLLASGVWDLSPQRHEGGGMRYLRFRRLLRDALEDSGAEVVGYEEVRNHMVKSKGMKKASFAVDAAHTYGAIVGMLQTVCEEGEVPYMGIPVGTIKKFATGKGNANKKAMLDAANERFADRKFKDDNEADAVFVALTTESKI